MPNTDKQGLYEISENQTNERLMREKMAKNTTGDSSVCGRSDRKRQQFPARVLIVSCCWPHVLHRWRSPPLSIYRADATSPRALPTPSPKWTVLRPASPGRPAAVTTTPLTKGRGEPAVSATAEPATAEMGDEVSGLRALTPRRALSAMPSALILGATRAPLSHRETLSSPYPRS